MQSEKFEELNSRVGNNLPEPDRLSLEEARGFAAQAWCAERTSSTVMDGDLAEEFAEILVNKVNEAVRSYRIREAARVYRDELSDDSLFQVYRDNVAMCIYDEVGIKVTKEERDNAASRILIHLFQE